MIIKTFTAGLLALTLGFTSITPTTATAGISDEEAIAGILTLFLLGTVIHNSRDNDPAPQRPRAQNNHRMLPANCLRRIERRNGNTVRMFTRACLIRENVRVNRLPQECHVRIRTANGNTRQGYRVGCMRNNGFRTSQR